ncbi:hypothetical protein BCY84_20622 [Trypanosoma cruzi cruzi]|nr:hypothetical protein BCY84_20622 [Trypanosoma cruzi cruzi]
MELRCFLVHCSNPSFGTSYVDIPPPSSCGSERHHGAVKYLGRHSPELYWRLGNNLRYSRRMMSLWVENASPEEIPLTARVHPHVAQRLVLKCIGKNAITVSRRTAGGNFGNLQAGENRILLRCNESVTLRVGDKVGVAHLVWMQVVLALVSVNCAVKAPVLVQQEEGNDAQYFSACRTLCPRLQDPPLPPVVHVNVAWMKLPSAIRAALAISVWERQLAADSGAVATAALTSLRPRTFAASPEAGDGMEEAAAISNSSQVIQEGGTITTSSETRSKRRLHASPSGSQGVESQLISLDVPPPQKKRRTSVAETAVMDNNLRVTLPENNTYYETFDERLDDAVRFLESRTEITNSLIAAGPPVPELLGESPPCEGRSVEVKKWARRSKSATVSRTELRHGNKQKEKELQLSSGHVEGEAAGGKNPFAGESQVVYYRR